MKFTHNSKGSFLTTIVFLCGIAQLSANEKAFKPQKINVEFAESNIELEVRDEKAFESIKPSLVNGTLVVPLLEEDSEAFVKDFKAVDHNAKLAGLSQYLKDLKDEKLHQATGEESSSEIGLKDLSLADLKEATLWGELSELSALNWAQHLHSDKSLEEISKLLMLELSIPVEMGSLKKHFSTPEATKKSDKKTKRVKKKTKASQP